jgi:hypothetical protein
LGVEHGVCGNAFLLHKPLHLRYIWSLGSAVGWYENDRYYKIERLPCSFTNSVLSNYRDSFRRALRFGAPSAQTFVGLIIWHGWQISNDGLVLERQNPWIWRTWNAFYRSHWVLWRTSNELPRLARVHLRKFRR